MKPINSKVPKWTFTELQSMLNTIEQIEQIPENSSDPEMTKWHIKQSLNEIIQTYSNVLDTRSINELHNLIKTIDTDGVEVPTPASLTIIINDIIDEWYNNVLNKDVIRPLIGHQNSNPAFMKPGIIIGYNGLEFDINNLRPEDFSKETQARCLSRESRFCGNTNKPYYVAQHCVVGAEFFLLMGRPDLARIFIRHEGSETILRDMTKPVKDMLKDYEALQQRLDQFNAEVHGLPFPFPPEIKMLDKNCAQYEMTFMMSTNLHTDYWTSEEAERRFIETWDKIEYILDTYYKQNPE